MYMPRKCQSRMVDERVRSPICRPRRETRSSLAAFPWAPVFLSVRRQPAGADMVCASTAAVAELRSVRVGETDDQHASRCVLPSGFDDLVPRLLRSLFQLLL